MATDKPRLMVTMEHDDRRELDALAGRMHMRPSTFAAWLLTNIVRNLDAADTVAAVLQRVQHSPPAMDAPKGPGNKTAHQGRSSGLGKGSGKGARRGARTGR